MSELEEVLASTLGSIYERYAGRDARTTDDGAFSKVLWDVLDEAGMTTIGSRESGGGEAALVALARATGRAAAAVPVVEMAGLASWLVTYAGLDLPTGIGTVVPGHSRDDLAVTACDGGWAVSGSAHRVPWGRDADWVAALVEIDGVDHVAVCPTGVVRHGSNLAGEPRDDLDLDLVVAADAVAPSEISRAELRRRGATLRAAQMAGALDAVRDLSIDYAQQREQFGVPIASFQAVQHHLVVIAEEALCTAMAVDLVAVSSEDQRELAVASAKVTAGRAAAEVTRRAHQVHAAIGVTAEHSLPWFTTRLWSWQDEFGSGAHWAELLGRTLLARPAADLWPTLSATVGAPGDAGDEGGLRS